MTKHEYRMPKEGRNPNVEPTSARSSLLGLCPCFVVRHSSFIILFDEEEPVRLSGCPVCHRLQHRIARRAYFCALRLSFKETDAHFTDQVRRCYRHQSSFRSALCRRACRASDCRAPPHPERANEVIEQPGRGDCHSRIGRRSSTAAGGCECHTKCRYPSGTKICRPFCRNAWRQDVVEPRVDR